MTQHQLADLTGIAQSSIAAYESGARSPSESSCRRILTAAGVRPSALLSAHRDQLVEKLAEHGATEIAVFGSVARGDDDEGSDLDLLVTLPAGLSLFDLVDLREEVENIIGTDVDLVSRETLRPDMFKIHRLVLDEAIPA